MSATAKATTRSRSGSRKMEWEMVGRIIPEFNTGLNDKYTALWSNTLLCKLGLIEISVTAFNYCLLMMKKSKRERFLFVGSDGIYVNSFLLGNFARKGSVRLAVLPIFCK